MAKGKYEDEKKDYKKGKNYKKRSKKNFNKEEEKDGVKYTKGISGINDIAWYQKNPQLIRDAGSIPFSDVLGLDAIIGPVVNGGDNVKDKLPGLITLPVTPSFGVTGYDSSAVNIAAQNIYSYIRHQNSGSKNYDVPDLFMYLAAMDQCYSYHSELCRVYGLLRFYNGYNRYMGRYLINALGFDYDNLVANMAQLRYTINQFAVKLSSFAVPAIMPLFERHRWMYANIYMDKPSIKAQLYAFTPKYYGQYIEPNNTAISVQTPYAYLAAMAGEADRNLTPKGWTLNQIESRTFGMTENLLGSEDIGTMSGDILKAYTAANCYSVNALPDDYMVAPMYVPEVLQQIHGATAVGDPIFIKNLDQVDQLLYQDGTTPFLYGWSETAMPMYYGRTGGPALPNEFNSPMGNWIIDFDHDGVTPEEIIEGTRLTTLPAATRWDPVGEQTFTANHGAFIGYQCYFKNLILGYDQIPVDVVSEFRVFSGEVDSTNFNLPFYTSLYSWMLDAASNLVTGLPCTVYFGKARGDMSKFDMHPLIFTYAYCDGQSGSQHNPNWSTLDRVEFDVFGQIENYATVSPNVIARLHDTALLSLLDVPTSVLTKGI